MLIEVIGGAPVKSWVYRASVIQGTQQILIAALFYWGRNATSNKQFATTTSTNLTANTLPISVLLWVIGIVLFLTLPPFYHQRAGKIPAFYSALRHPVTAWFFVAVILHN